MIRFGANRHASEPNQRESGNEKKKTGRSSTRKQRRPSRFAPSGRIECGSGGHFAASVHPRRQLTPLRARQWRVLFFVCKFAPNWAVLAETGQIGSKPALNQVEILVKKNKTQRFELQSNFKNKIKKHLSLSNDRALCLSRSPTLRLSSLTP